MGESDGAKELAKFGKTIADAIAFYLPHLQANKRTCTFAELIAQLIAAKACVYGGRLYLFLAPQPPTNC